MFLPLVSLLLSGCMHKVELTSVPAGATITVGKHQLAPAQKVVRVGWFQRRDVTVSLAGYRTLKFKLRPGVNFGDYFGELITIHWARMVGYTTHSTYEIRLVPEHGGAGTWSPEDAR
jgi:hypothetical protein